MVCKDGADACYPVCEPSPYSIPKTPVFLKMQDCILQVQCLQRCLTFQKKAAQIGCEAKFLFPTYTFSDVQVLRAHVRTTGSDWVRNSGCGASELHVWEVLAVTMMFTTVWDLQSKRALHFIWLCVWENIRKSTSFKVLETLKGAYTTSTSVLLPSSWEVWVSPAPRRL